MSPLPPFSRVYVVSPHEYLGIEWEGAVACRGSKDILMAHASVHPCAVLCASVAGGRIWLGSGYRCSSLGPVTCLAFEGEAGEAGVLLLAVVWLLSYIALGSFSGRGRARSCTKTT